MTTSTPRIGANFACLTIQSHLMMDAREEIARQRHNLVEIHFERPVATVEQMQLRIGKSRRLPRRVMPVCTKNQILQ
jgi:hypothetical protein